MTGFVGGGGGGGDMTFLHKMSLYFVVNLTQYQDLNA